MAASTLTNGLSGGTNLVLNWPLDHTGYRLLTQTNNLNKGISGNMADWGGRWPIMHRRKRQAGDGKNLA